MSKMSDLHIEREEYRSLLSEALDLPLTIIESKDPLTWIYELPDGRTITYTHVTK